MQRHQARTRGKDRGLQGKCQTDEDCREKDSGNKLLIFLLLAFWSPDLLFVSEFFGGKKTILHSQVTSSTPCWWYLTEDFLLSSIVLTSNMAAATSLFSYFI